MTGGDEKIAAQQPRLFAIIRPKHLDLLSILINGILKSNRSVFWECESGVKPIIGKASL
jgi:hypothetical protein